MHIDSDARSADPGFTDVLGEMAKGENVGGE